MDLSPRGLILFAISIAFIVAIVPPALNDIFAVNTSTWGSAAALWVVVGLAIVATLVLAFVPSKGGKGAS